LESAPLDFSSLCRQTVNRFTHLAALKNITLKRDIDEELWLFGDEIILDRMLANVLDNAIKYTKPDGHIAFSIKTDGDFLIVTCLNTHPPLSAEQLQNLCLPYYRAEEGRIYGSGLGLYLVKKIVLLHGGSLEVKNDPPGVCVTIKLPRPDEPQT
ncbi:MAG: HAMP domain-containing histidine kinase, partial [Deltaproteobacteria bacterium]|nr:HAMP domain-containing histidine kinase [Deltaproteobacteria bacterium]